MGSAVASDTRFWACVALVLSWSLIIIYLWIRFQGVAFGLAAVIALIHDVLVMLGAIAFSSYLALIPGVSTVTLIEPFKINLTIVAAFLTIIGYSVNDTIVVFDRIREIRGKSPTLTRQMVNDATNQTLSRTVLTSFTVLAGGADPLHFRRPGRARFCLRLVHRRADGHVQLDLRGRADPALAAAPQGDEAGRSGSEAA